MAVIKSGDSTDQLHVDTHQAAYVTLRDASGASITPIQSGGTIVANIGTPGGLALESGGHLASVDAKLAINGYGIKTSSVERDGQLGTGAVVTALGDRQVASRTLLVGFQATNPIDTVQWTTTLTGTGAVTTSTGAFVLTTGATANSTALLQSLGRSQLFAGTQNIGYFAIALPDTGTTNNERRWGCYDAGDGVFFSLLGTSLGFTIRINGTDTRSTAWNGTTPILDTQPHIWTIVWAQGGVALYQDGVFATSVIAANTVFVNPHLKLTAENINTAGSTTNVSLPIVGQAIYRLGESADVGKFLNISANGTTVIKRGPGRLQGVNIGVAGAAGNLLTLFDNTAGSGTPIATINTTAINAFDYRDVNFNNGLTAVLATGTAANVTILFQ